MMRQTFALFLLSLLLFSGGFAQTVPDTAVVISEIMYDPPSDANSADEFVEVFNTSPTQSFNLRGWRIGDAAVLRTIADTTATNTGNATLAPRSFAVIFTGTDFRRAFAYYRPLIPAGTLILRTTASIAFNNTGIESVRLLNERGDTLANFTYTGVSSNRGRSLEKIILNRDDTPTNFSPSLNIGGTPGSQNSVSPLRFDLRNVRLSFLPADSVVQGTSVTLQAVLQNAGTEPISSFSVEFYEDLDSNHILSPNERFETRSVSSTLQPNDSLRFEIAISTPALGLRRFATVAALANDERRTNDTLRRTLRVVSTPVLTPADTSIIISEIMYDPPEDANATADEFVELYNTHPSLSIDLRGWRIGGTVNLTLTDSGATGTGNTVLPPRRFAVVFSPSYFTSGQFYRNRIPQGALVLRASGSLSLSNTADTVTLLTPRNLEVARTSYVGNARNKGFSLEKIILSRDDASTNFAPSLVQGGTPGFINSVTPKERDLALRIAEQFSTPPQTAITIPYTVQNRGLLAFGNGATTRVFEDRNRNAIGEPTEQISTSTLMRDLAPRDSIRQSFTYTPRTAEPVEFILTLSITGDEDTSNNVARTRLLSGAPRTSVIINEIMYAPIQDPNDFKPDQPEYVELFNRSNAPVDLRGWFITDAPNERGEFNQFFFAQDSSENYVLQPNEYAVVAPDRATVRDSTRLVQFFTYLQSDRNAKLFTSVRSSPTSRTNLSDLSLNNDGDLVALYDNTGFLVDSVRYSPRWHNPFFSSTRGLSLERINPNGGSNDARNWTTSTNREFGGTPARQNSTFAPSPEISGTASTLALSPNPFSPDGDGRDDFLVIRYQLQGTANRIRIKIFDARGRLVRTLANSEPSGAQGEVIWDGLDDNRQPLRMGIYILYLEALDASSAIIETLRQTAVLAKPM
ncbi:MAG: hypothetical protein CMR00_08130 [[Chlorobium] sp. 445]|nr:MAG: hypothetical protein CMR00_08130 [[Chlorobium] sp. 445]